MNMGTCPHLHVLALSSAWLRAECSYGVGLGMVGVMFLLQTLNSSCSGVSHQSSSQFSLALNIALGLMTERFGLCA